MSTTPAKRISPHEARELLDSNPDAMLVSAYRSGEKFDQNHLAGAVPLDQFEEQADHLDRDRPLVFYCA